MNFNKDFIISYGSGNFVIDFDPSYISKSEIAAIDIDHNTAFHIEAIQTPTYKELEDKNITIRLWYAEKNC